VATLVALIALAAGTVGALIATRASTPSHPVPNLVGLTQVIAEQRLQPLHLHLRVASSLYEAHAPAGTVVSQIPTAGRLKEGGSVAVTLSRGPQPVAVPDVHGLTAGDATALLHRLGLQTAVARRTSLTTPVGSVISSSPSQGSLPPGGTVTLVVSTGRPTVPVPAINGTGAASFAAAQAALGAVGLSASETDEYSDTVAKGSVIGTVPPAGSAVPVGSQVTVVVSKGPHLVLVPNVAGQSVGAASQVLAAAGFQISGVTGNPIATVMSTSPQGGTLAHFGAPVQLITG
jgi:serine/threonine-protein kinase